MESPKTKIITAADFPGLLKPPVFSASAQAAMKGCKDAMGVTHYFDAVTKGEAHQLLDAAKAKYRGMPIRVEHGKYVLGYVP